MARYIQLTKNGETVPFNKIDNEICARFGVEPDAVKFYNPLHECNWYDALGWTTAETLEQMIIECNDRFDTGLSAVYLFLVESGYTLNVWYER